MSSIDPDDNPKDQYELIYHKLDNIYIMTKNQLSGISFALIILIAIELYKLLH
jgi:hypothetical protein